MLPSERWKSLVEYWAERVKLPPDLVFRQMMAESAGNPKARSSSGALGLLQLMPGTARDLGVENPLDPDENLRGGTEYLSGILWDLKRRFGPASAAEDDYLRFSLVGYNAGPGYARTALRHLAESGLPLTWDSFKTEMARVEIGGKKPRTKECLPYAEKIHPPNIA